MVSQLFAIMLLWLVGTDYLIFDLFFNFRGKMFPMCKQWTKQLIILTHKSLDKEVPPAGLEPTTFGLEVQRAIQLRHEGSPPSRQIVQCNNLCTKYNASIPLYILSIYFYALPNCLLKNCTTILIYNHINIYLLISYIVIMSYVYPDKLRSSRLPPEVTRILYLRYHSDHLGICHTK